jgi:hypothetical protein
MKKMLFLTLALVLALSVPAFAQIINTATGLAATIKDNNQNQNTNLNTDVNTNVNTNVFTPINANSNIQGQQQGQLQGQMQGQGQLQGQANFQNISPSQSVSFNSPTQLLPLPSQIIPEINFGSGKMIDATASLPNFAIYGIKKIGAESIREVLNVNANVKFKNLYEAILSDAKDIANGGKKTLSDVRYQIVRAEAQKTWTLGANLGAGTSILSSTGASGGSGAGSLGPAWGGTKADDLFTIIFVRVAV